MSAPFAQITQGPATATGNNPNKQALLLDRQNTIVEVVGDAGLAMAVQTALLVQGAQTALTAITTAQNLINVALPAGALNKLLRTLEISGTVIFTVATGTPTVTLNLKLGSVTLCTIASAALQAVTAGQLQFLFTLGIASAGSSGTIESHGLISVQLGGTTAPAVAAFADTNAAVSSAVNLTSALALTLNIVGSTAIASAQLRQSQILVIN